jgi:hypothetical protein
MAEFPRYSFEDEMKAPSEMNIRRDGSFGGIMRAVAGVNYYSDAVGFGEATGLAKANGLGQLPMGIRYFIKTGQQCSNGADMYEYVDLIPKGDLVGKRIGDELRKTGLPRLKGLAPGILEDARDALNPLPLLQAAAGTGYPKCKKVTRQVGDSWGHTRSQYDKENIWIKDKIDKYEGVFPFQTRWVFDKWISMEEYDKTPKTEAPIVEGFDGGVHPVHILLLIVLPLCFGFVLSLQYSAPYLLTKGGMFLLVLLFSLGFLLLFRGML